MNMEIVNPVDYPHWDDLVLATNKYSIFHSSHWAKVLCNSYHHSPAYFIGTEKEHLLALIPIMGISSILTGRRGVSLAFSDYCEPIAADQGTFLVLLGHIIDYARECGWKYLEMRGGEEYLADAPASAEYLCHWLVLDDNEEALLSRFRGNTRWSIRKAVQEGVEVNVDATLDSIKEFYRLHCLTRKRHGVPPQPFHFFRNIHDCILDQGLGSVVLASHKNRTIAGAVCFRYGTRALYKYSASDSDYRQLCANNLVLWEAIKHYAVNGCDLFCLGRTERDNKGLHYFKNGWGTVEEKIRYFTYDITKRRFVGKDKKPNSLSSRIMQKLPACILKASGELLYRHMD